MGFQRGYAYKVLLYLDILGCSVIWRDPDVTISSETGLAMRKPNPPRWAKVLNAVLNRIQPNHCQLAIQDDIDRAKRAIVYLGG